MISTKLYVKHYQVLKEFFVLRLEYTLNIDSTIKAKLTDTVKAAMPMIKFVAC